MSEVLSDPPAVIRRKTDIAEVGDSTDGIMHSQKPGQQQSPVGKTVLAISKKIQRHLPRGSADGCAALTGVVSVEPSFRTVKTSRHSGRASASAVHKQQCHGMFSEQLKACSTSTEIVKVLLLTISYFTSRREVSQGSMSHLQALLAANPCPL